MIWRALAFLAFLLSIAALVIAVMAYQRAGGELKIWGQIDNPHQVIEGIRQGTANTLDRLENFVRGDQQHQAGVKGLREK